MKKVLWVFLAIVLLALIINYPLIMIGLGLAVWGYYEWRVNKKLKAKSKKPITILIVGILVMLCGVGIADTSTTDVAKESDVTSGVKSDEAKEKNAEKEKQEKAEKEKIEEKKKAKEEAEKLAAEQKAREEAEKAEKAKAEAQAKAEQEKKNRIQNLGLVAATVSRVVDGDTVELSDGSKVRLIGVNTPESTTRHEKYGKEASNYTTSKLSGKRVYLQKDVSETDRYGRLLRIIWLDIPTDDMNEKEIRTKMFNADLVINGYAEPSTYPPDVKYAEYFRKFAREARANGTGLWAYGKDGTTKGDFDQQSSSGSTTNSSSSSRTSSGSSNNTSSRSSSNSKTTSTPSAPATNGGTEYFANCTELTKVYPHGVPKGHPAYQSKMDRDKDGYACER